MIRVVYEWRVEASNQAAFIAASGKTTTAIRDSVDGARRSTLLRSKDSPQVFLSIARLDSEEQWKSFREGPDRTEMSEMHALAERLSVNAYEEEGEFTV